MTGQDEGIWRKNHPKIKREGRPLCYWARSAVEQLVEAQGANASFVRVGDAEADDLDEATYLVSRFEIAGHSYEVFIYQEQLEYFVDGVSGFFHEWQDYESEEEMLADFLSELSHRLEK